MMTYFDIQTLTFLHVGAAAIYVVSGYTYFYKFISRKYLFFISLFIRVLIFMTIL